MLVVAVRARVSFLHFVQAAGDAFAHVVVDVVRLALPRRLAPPLILARGALHDEVAAVVEDDARLAQSVLRTLVNEHLTLGPPCV